MGETTETDKLLSAQLGKQRNERVVVWLLLVPIQ